MESDRVMRVALLTTVPFNVFGAALFAFPDSRLSQSAGLPGPVPGIYCAILAFFVLLFGAAYLWLALQRSIGRSMVALLAIGKTGVFLIVSIFCLFGAAPARAAVISLGDLAFAGIFFWWLLDGRARTD